MKRTKEIGSAGLTVLARPIRLSDQIYESILREVDGGAYGENGKLPTESALCERFRVSRPVVREALARLQLDGLVYSIQGSGTFIRRKPTSAVLKFAPMGSIADIQRCFEFREALEGETAFLAAERRTDEDLAAMKQALEALQEAIDTGRLGQEEDMAFHAAVTRATQNQYFVSVSKSIASHTSFGIALSRTLAMQQPSKRLFQVQREHVDVYDAIREGSATNAREAMRRHIMNARSRIFEGRS